ncbi:hypothetical protein AYL99_06492 [Fonsecaea erecta]|uniref:Zn(2)-C6 fungal-type domain-containing protein n=1 Tax=Fonsecaea erecta TaxID=1367422 RepID=A0A178ZHA8_9EURO|nr:hypothetical protein AYL99_06492 [Fonsecaea erecta]OAP59194.1 hypothetical protein AYL99_06492 [Fonsecaea erecta]
MSFANTILVTGSKSGIGKGLLATYAARPNTLAIAAIRDGPDSEAAKTLTSLPVGAGSKIIVAKYDASSKTAAVELADYLKSVYNVSALDVVVANAGILKHFGPAKEASAETIMEHLQINTLAPILLYQGTQELLNASRQSPKFFIISSSIGSNSLQDHYPLPVIAYGMSKAAVNWAVSRIHREEDRITVVAMQPGWVQTAMGNTAAELAGMKPEEVPVKLEDSVSGLISVFDKADKATYSGKFWDQNGAQCDEKRPECGNCIKRKQQCPGYRNSFDAVHKDETLTTSRKSAPKRQKKVHSPTSDSSDSSISVSNPPSPSHVDRTLDLALFTKPSRNLEMESLCYFFTNYVNIPRDPSTNIFIEYILPIYLNTAPSSALAEAINASAINITSMWMNRYVDSYRAREAYAKAVTSLKLLLQDPIEAKADETLATVFMLDFYDSLNRRFVHFVDTGTHQQGAVALLKHRGRDSFNTPLSQRLFNAMRSRHINYSLQFGKRVELDPELLTDETAVLPSAKLDLLNVELADLLVLARDGPEAAGLSLADFYRVILDRALSLEKRLQAWVDALPKSWQPVSIPASELHHSIRDAGVYEGMCDVYSSLAVSHVNNAARSSQIGAIRLITRCSRGLNELGIAVDPQIEPYVDLRVQEVVDRFCASVPFHLGNRTRPAFPDEHREYPHVPAELRRLASYVDPFGNEVEMTMEDHVRAAAAIGGWFIMVPLAGFLRARAMAQANSKPGPLVGKLRKGQVAWVRGQMERIQKIYLFPTNGSPTEHDWKCILKQFCDSHGDGHNLFQPLAFNQRIWTA